MDYREGKGRDYPSYLLIRCSYSTSVFATIFFKRSRQSTAVKDSKGGLGGQPHSGARMQEGRYDLGALQHSFLCSFQNRTCGLK